MHKVRKSALIVVDMQMGFMNEHTEYLENKIASYIDNRSFDIIIGTKYINNEKTACYIFEGWKECMDGTVDTYLVPKISSRVNVTFEKSVYSCWSETLKDYLKSRNIDDIYFCGVNTGCCVLHSAFDAYNDLFSCYVIEDLCGSTSGEESHKAAITILKECITQERVIDSSLDIK